MKCKIYEINVEILDDNTRKVVVGVHKELKEFESKEDAQKWSAASVEREGKRLYAIHADMPEMMAVRLIREAMSIVEGFEASPIVKQFERDSESGLEPGVYLNSEDIDKGGVIVIPFKDSRALFGLFRVFQRDQSVPAYLRANDNFPKGFEDEFETALSNTMTSAYKMLRNTEWMLPFMATVLEEAEGA